MQIYDYRCQQDDIFVDFLPLLDGDKLCPATQELFRWRAAVKKDPFQLFHQKPN